MASIIEIARFANVSAENVLRVVHGEPVSEEISLKVGEAIDALGPPPYPTPTVEVLPARAPAAPPEPRPDDLLERFAQATAELEASLPQGVSSVVYEALRVEVRPVAQHVAEMGSLFEQMVRRLEQMSADVGLERRERVEDVALLTELIATGWRTVDRRLARLEALLARMEAKGNGKAGPRLLRVDEHPGRRVAD
jgi:hypothetical protein